MILCVCVYVCSVCENRVYGGNQRELSLTNDCLNWVVKCSAQNFQILQGSKTSPPLLVVVAARIQKWNSSPWNFQEN